MSENGRTNAHFELSGVLAILPSPARRPRNALLAYCGNRSCEHARGPGGGYAALRACVDGPDRRLRPCLDGACFGGKESSGYVPVSVVVADFRLPHGGVLDRGLAWRRAAKGEGGKPGWILR